MKIINCIDTGLITQYYCKNPPDNIKNFMDTINKSPHSTVIPKEVLIETYKHMCVSSGTDVAKYILSHFNKSFNVILQDLNEELIQKAGKLKCQFRTKLSYIDCIGIAVSLKYNAVFHTTEKNLPKIPHLKVKQYSF